MRFGIYFCNDVCVCENFLMLFIGGLNVYWLKIIYSVGLLELNQSGYKCIIDISNSNIPKGKCYNQSNIHQKGILLHDLVHTKIHTRLEYHIMIHIMKAYEKPITLVISKVEEYLLQIF